MPTERVEYDLHGTKGIESPTTVVMSFSHNGIQGHSQFCPLEEPVVSSEVATFICCQLDSSKRRIADERQTLGAGIGGAMEARILWICITI